MMPTRWLSSSRTGASRIARKASSLTPPARSRRKWSSVNVVGPAISRAGNSGRRRAECAQPASNGPNPAMKSSAVVNRGIMVPPFLDQREHARRPYTGSGPRRPCKPRSTSRVGWGAIGKLRFERQARLGAALRGANPAREPRGIRRDLRRVRPGAVRAGAAAAAGQRFRGRGRAGRDLPGRAREAGRLPPAGRQPLRLAGEDRREQGDGPSPGAHAHGQGAGELRIAGRAAARGRPCGGRRGGSAARSASPAEHRGRGAGPPFGAVPARHRAADARGPAARRVRAAAGNHHRELRRAAAARAAGVSRRVDRATRRELGGAMTDEERPPTPAELREAELLARMLEEPSQPGRELTSVDDALGVAYLLRASKQGELGELRARAVRQRIWRKGTWPLWARAAAAALAGIGAAAVILAVRPRGPARLPPPGVRLLQAQLAAARPGSSAELAQLEVETAAYRERFYGALALAYGSRP